MVVDVQDAAPCPARQVVQLVVAVQSPWGKAYVESQELKDPSSTPLFRFMVHGILDILARADDSCVIINAHVPADPQVIHEVVVLQRDLPKRPSGEMDKDEGRYRPVGVAPRQVKAA